MCSMDSFQEVLEAFERAWHDRQTSGPSMASQLKAALDDVETHPDFDQAEYDRLRLKLGLRPEEIHA